LRFILLAAVLVVAAALVAPGMMHREGAGTPSGEPAARTAAALGGAGDMPGRAVINADAAGRYRAEVVVDDRLLDMIVDTGASAVVLRYEDASRLGLAGAASSFEVPVATANGRTNAARITLDSVAIGGIRLYDVPGLVAPPGALAANLLGMSALSRLHRIEARQGQLVLED
jgi:aspartyl protease family protein